MPAKIAYAPLTVLLLLLAGVCAAAGAQLRPQVTPPNKPQKSAAQAKPGEITENPKDGLKYVWIPAGTFQMGCSPGDSECDANEKPAHQVKISRGFWMGQTEVTAGAYKRFASQTGRGMPPEPVFLTMKLNEGWGNPAMPIVNISWNDAQAYCQWAGGRLSTEAEWEYAARGGSTEARYGPLDEVAWYVDNSGNARLDAMELLRQHVKNYARRLAENGDRAHEVGQKRANGFGLFDMLGNVWEWVRDYYDQSYYAGSPGVDPPGPSSGKYHVLRGGSWLFIARDSRVSSRDKLVPNDTIGCRCAREVAP